MITTGKEYTSSELSARLKHAIGWMLRERFDDYGKLYAKAWAIEPSGLDSTTKSRVIVGFSVLGPGEDPFGIEFALPNWTLAKSVVERAEALADGGTVKSLTIDKQATRLRCFVDFVRDTINPYQPLGATPVPNDPPA